MTHRFLYLLIGLIVLGGCDLKERVEERLRPTAPYTAYLFDLEEADLLEAPMSQRWQQRGKAVLGTQLTPDLPFEGVTFFAAERPDAIGYRFTLQRGEQVHIQAIPVLDGRLFLDLFRIPADTTLNPVRVFGTDSTFTHTFEARRDDTYIVRIQPELLSSGQVTLRLWTGPSLAFPVADHTSRAIRSFFGADRDGGRRRHHGVDIFAPRGTPVVAVANGPVTRVENTNLGGKVVWQRDTRRGLAIYYAHLDSQAVRPRYQAKVGDTLGFVGNTGNARTTPPHLHFGIYQRGPHDPFPFIDTNQPEPRPSRLDDGDLGAWQRTTAQTTIRSTPNHRAGAITTLPNRTVLRADAGTTGWLHVRLPDGREGWVQSRDVQPATPVFTVAPTVAFIRSAPSPSAVPLGQTAGDTRALGFFGDYALVPAPAGGTGWVVVGG
ncbi:MAG: hypothetical protein RhofKO_34490 [Rhodothermales bacterium]